MAALCYGMIDGVRVMLIDNDSEFVTEMVDLLKSYDYKVVIVGTASAAMSMLSKGEQKIDVMIFNVHSLNMLSFQLLAQAIILDIISLVVYDEHNEHVAKKALDEGAYLCLAKPVDKEIIKYLWQFVLREKIQREKSKEGSAKNRHQMNVDDIGNNNVVGENEEQPKKKKNVSNTEEWGNNILEVENNIVLNEKYKLRRKRGRKDVKEIKEGERQRNDINKVVRQNNCIEWTDDLHAKFMKVVQQLGEGRCYPKDILEEMNIPGLTRRQIASHLQKCRHPSSQGSSGDFHESRSSFKKFGTMPHLQKYVSNLQRNPNQTQRGSEFPLSTLNTNNIFAREESSIQQQLYLPQLPIQPHYLDICNPFNNPFFWSKNNVVGGIQQEYNPLSGMLNSQGLQGQIIENTNYRPDLVLNSGDHHTQRDYSLDLNMAQGATYSENKIISSTDIQNAVINDHSLNVNEDNVIRYSSNTEMLDTYAGNVTINKFGAANLNFQQYISESNMPDPRNIVTESYASDTEGRNSNEKENSNAYFGSNNMYYSFQNCGHPSANLPNEQGGETSSVQFSGETNFF